LIAGTVAELLPSSAHHIALRPRVSNDNPCIERTSRPQVPADYPTGSTPSAPPEHGCASSGNGTTLHYHSAIGYLRPADLHDGNHTTIIEHRQAVLDAAAAAHPERFTRRPTPPKVPTRAWINKPTIQSA